MERFAIRLHHDSLTFSSCHMLVFPSKDDRGMMIEPLHGHDFHAALKISGPLNLFGCVVDFIDVSRLFRETLDSFDHRVLIAAACPYLNLSFDEHGGLELVFDESNSYKRWMFPADNFLLLDADNASTERIACAILKRFRSAFFEKLVVDRNESDYAFELELEECPGCAVVVQT